MSSSSGKSLMPTQAATPTKPGSQSIAVIKQLARGLARE